MVRKSEVRETYLAAVEILEAFATPEQVQEIVRTHGEPARCARCGADVWCLKLPERGSLLLERRLKRDRLLGGNGQLFIPIHQHEETS